MTDRVAKLSPFEAIERIQDACDGRLSAPVRNHQPPVTCAIGCAHCCRQPVFITRWRDWPSSIASPVAG